VQEKTAEKALRGDYRRAGMELHKVSERSRWYWQYGPYMAVDVNTSGIVTSGMDLAEAREFVDATE